MGLIAGVDLNWATRPRVRVAVALVDKVANFQVHSILNDEEIFTLLSTVHHAQVTLDIPIDGCQALSRINPFHSVDRALFSTEIPLLPSYKASTHGLELRDRLGAGTGR